MAGKPQKNLAYSVLLDFYGPVLTDKQRVILTEYYDEDLSLAEIARTSASRGRGCGTPSSTVRPRSMSWSKSSATPAATPGCRLT